MKCIVYSIVKKIVILLCIIYSTYCVLQSFVKCDNHIVDLIKSCTTRIILHNGRHRPRVSKRKKALAR